MTRKQRIATIITIAVLMPYCVAHAEPPYDIPCLIEHVQEALGIAPDMPEIKWGIQPGYRDWFVLPDTIYLNKDTMRVGKVAHELAHLVMWLHHGYERHDSETMARWVERTLE